MSNNKQRFPFLEMTVEVLALPIGIILTLLGFVLMNKYVP